MAPLVSLAADATAPAGSPKTEAKAGASQPASAAAEPITIPQDVQELMEAAMTKYRAAKSYQDEYVQEVKVEGAGTEMLKTSAADRQKLIFAEPNKISLHTDSYNIVSDGKHIWEQIPPLEQYVERPAEPTIDFDKMAMSHFQAFQSSLHPIADILCDKTLHILTAIGDVKKFESVHPETRRGQAGKAFSGMTSNAAIGSKLEVPFTAWFGPSGLLEEITYDLTKPLQARLEKQGALQAGIHMTSFKQFKRFEKPTLDGTIPANAFVLDKSPYDRKVAEFEPVNSDELQMRLIGRPAPAFTTMDLQGKPVKLADYKGKVLLLDFWATYCGPCIMSMPHIQQLSEKFAKQPVAVVGVNGDPLPPASQPAESPAARFQPIVDFVKSKKLTYSQLMDPDGQISNNYRVGGIPSVVLIDKTGIIRAIHNGYSEASAARYALEIDKLLKGQPISTQPSEEAAGG